MGSPNIDKYEVALLQIIPNTNRTADLDNVNEMILLRNLYLSALFTCALAHATQPHHITASGPDGLSTASNGLFPRAPPGWLTTQSTGAHVTWGNHAVTFWRTTALLPVVAAATPLRDFYQKLTLATVQAITAQLVTNTYTFGLGALSLHIDTLDGSPIDWNTVIAFAGNMVGATNAGWTDHYAAVVKNTVTGVLTAVSLGVVGEGVGAWLGSGTSVEQFRNHPFGS